MGKRPSSKLVLRRTLALLWGVVLAAWWCGLGPQAADYGSTRAATERAAPARRYNNFSHRGAAHQRLKCSACHTFPSPNWKAARAGDAAFPDITEYPSHNACLKCHHEQFFNGRPPAICTICHVNPTPRNSARQPFANPVETFEKSAKGRVAQSDFRVYFPHENHSDVVGGNTAGKNGTQAAHARPQDANCAVCHSLAQPQGDADQEFLTPPPANWGDNFWLKKGTFQTAPRGHKTCFECHYSTGDIINPPPSQCAACHRLAPARPATPDFNAKLAAQIKIPDRATLASWRERDSSGTFRHEIHSETKCTACHNTAKMNTADLSTLKVPIMSCGGEGCHITPTTDDGGALNYELDQRQADAKFQCAKCHLSLAGKPVPASHTNAVAAYKAK